MDLSEYGDSDAMGQPRSQMADPTSDRLPPHSIEAEQGVLGCILLAPFDTIYDCIAEMPDGEITFYDLRHRTLYALFVDMADKLEAIDLITVRQRLSDNQQLEAVGGISYLAALPDSVPSAANLSFYVNIVREKYILRKILTVCTNIAGRIYTDAAEDMDRFIDSSEAQFMDAARNKSSKIAVQCQPSVVRCIEQIESMQANQGALAGLASGFTDFDRLTSGLRGGDLIVIAARPSVGKSAISMNIAEAVACDQKAPVGVFSLEMTEDQLVMRMLCSRARVNLRNVRDGFMADRDYPKITTAASKIGGAPIYIDDTAGLSIMELRSRARKMWQMYGIKLFVVDYLQLLHSTARRAMTRQQEIGDISRGLKQLGKDLDVPVLVLAQLGRGLEKDGYRKPRLSDLREGGDIENDADIVGLLYKPQSDEDDDAPESDGGLINLLIGKNRNGPVGEFGLVFLKSYTRFESAARISPDDPEPQQSQMPV